MMKHMLIVEDDDAIAMARELAGRTGVTPAAAVARAVRRELELARAAQRAESDAAVARAIACAPAGPYNLFRRGS